MGERAAWRRAKGVLFVVVVLAVATAVSAAIGLWWPFGSSGGEASAAGQAAASPSTAAGARASSGRIVAVGAESQYADVIAQVGGDQVRVSSVLRDPNTDPHAYEASPETARLLASAQLVVQNGLGYDAFMTTIERASPNPRRTVIDVQSLRRLPDSTANPHLWYTPATMPAVAGALAKDLASLDPAHRDLFFANAARFDRSLQPWHRAMASLRADFPGTPVATTEPVADDLLRAIGARNLTPFSFQADVMNGTDPSPQDVAVEQRLLEGGEVKAFVYNAQVTDPLTQSLLGLAKAHHIPVVGVYETMPTPGHHYQSWMVAEVHALRQAFATGRSSSKP